MKVLIMWHLGFRKEKDLIALIIVFVILATLVIAIFNQCDFFGCEPVPAMLPLL